METENLNRVLGKVNFMVSGGYHMTLPFNLPPHGWHTLDTECKGVLSIGVYRVLVGNRVGVDLARSTIRLLLPFLFPVKGVNK